MRINNNLMAMNTHRQLGIANNSSSKSMEKLSSGYRINRAGDDAAGLSISEKMRGQIRGLTQASRNAQDGISLIQTAEGALNETHSILQRMRELTVQAGNGTNESEDLLAIKDEMDALINEIDGIADRTQFNGKTLLNGAYKTAGSGITFQIGANGGQQVELTIKSMKSEDLATAYSYVEANGTKVDITDSAFTVQNLDVTKFGDNSFEKQLGAIDSAIKEVSSQRSSLGALQNRLEHTIKNLDNGAENLQAAESRIRDVDMAQEMMELTKQNILQQASQAMLAQANQAPQGVLQLLR